MSDTDSENDYASADEDTGEIAKEKIPFKNEEKEVSHREEKESVEIKISNDSEKSNEKIYSTKSKAKNEIINVQGDVKITQEQNHEDQCDSYTEDNSLKRNAVINVPKTENKVLVKIENSEPSFEPKVENINLVSVDESNDSSQLPVNDENVSNVARDVPSKRVTLRLEQKIQEKNKAANLSESSADNKVSKPPDKQSWGFSSWGTSFLSTAASSVSTFTNQVSQGIGTVLETVETTLGAPPPEDLAKVLRERKDADMGSEKKTPEASPDKEQDDDGIPSTGSLFTGITSVTKAIESTGSKVLMGGLDTLELIGKKTFDLITEGDPGLRNRRSAFSSGITLSQVLREAKEKAEDHSDSAVENQEDSVHFSTYFDDFQGLVHLEALEMLSAECLMKVQGALMASSEKENLDRVRSLFEDLSADVPESETQDFEGSLAEHLKNLQLQIDMQKIITVQRTVHQWLDMCTAEQEAGQAKNAKDLYRHAISSLAEFSARCVEHFHKLGELLLVQTISDFDSIECATKLIELTSVLCIEVGIMSAKYSQCLNTAADDSEDPDTVIPLITNVYLESSNSTTYIQDAVQLLLPVIQTVTLS